MDSLVPPKPPYQETLQSPLFPVTIEIPLPYEYPINLSATSTPPSHSPLEPMDAHKLFHLSENIDDINRIVELLEPNELLLRTWSYFGHCQWTMRKLEEEMRYQKDSTEDLLVELRKLMIDEVLCPLIAEARQLDQWATHFARPASPITIRLLACTPAPPTDTTTNYSMEQDTGGPSQPIIIINDETTTPPTTSTSSSGPPFKKRRGTPRRTSSYVWRKRQATPNLGSLGLERG